jgi:hypothetical protein
LPKRNDRIDHSRHFFGEDPGRMKRRNCASKSVDGGVAGSALRAVEK